MSPETKRVEYEIPLAYRSPYALATRGGTLYLRNDDEARIAPFEYRVLDSARVIADPVVAKIRYEHRIANKSGMALLDTRVIAPMPRDDLRQQKLGHTFFGAPTERAKDRYGQELLVFKVGRVEAGQEVRLGYELTVRLWALRNVVRPDFTMTWKAPPAEARATAIAPDLEYVSFDDPAVKELAKSVSARRDRPALFMRDVRDAVFAALEYEIDDDRQTAANTLKTGNGSCTEYSFVTAATYMRNGYGVRFSGGSVATGLANGGEPYVDDVHHRWIEVWMEGLGWVAVDCNRNDDDDPPWSDEFVPGVARNILNLTVGGGGDEEWLGVKNVSTTRYSAEKKGIDHDLVETASDFTWTIPD